MKKENGEEEVETLRAVIAVLRSEVKVLRKKKNELEQKIASLERDYNLKKRAYIERKWKEECASEWEDLTKRIKIGLRKGFYQEFLGLFSKMDRKDKIELLYRCIEILDDESFDLLYSKFHGEFIKRHPELKERRPDPLELTIKEY